MTTPDHIKRIIERLEPTDREALDQHLSILIENRDKAEHQAGILGDKLEDMTCKAGDLGDKVEELKSLRNRAGVELEHALQARVKGITWCPSDRLGRVVLLSQKVDELRQERDALAAHAKALTDSFDLLIASSDGVAGLHMNGDLAPWGELTEGGRFEEWLLPLSKTPAASLAEVRAQAIEQFAKDELSHNNVESFSMKNATLRYADRIRKEAQ